MSIRKANGMVTQAVVVGHLTKHFGEVLAVNDISFEIQEGEIFGILGPNGAGKTTTIRMLTGVLPPTSGDISILHQSMPKESAAIKEKIGVLPETANVYGDMTGSQNLHLYGRLYGLETRVIKERSENLLREMSLYGQRDQVAKTYSKGMKQRLSLAMTLMSQGHILFLDEPTSGLDPKSALQIRSVILDLAASQRTILLTTHNMKEAEELCDRVAIMNNGRIAAIDTPANLRSAFQARQSVVIEFSNTPDIDAVRSIPEVNDLISTGSRVKCYTSDPGEVLIQLLEITRKSGLRILHVQTEAATLEDVFLDLTQESV
ncbi:MAG: ABC transporter ATP-binding protein [Candidatus Thorarchaeota archaeon]